MNTVEYIYRDLKDLLETVVIKYDRSAKDNETVESRRNSDMYISAKLEMDTFNSHVRFSKDAIRNCGIFDEDLVEKYHLDKKLIPDTMRQRVLREERFLIIENYDEQNNYYRELSGKPNTDDFDFIYLPLEICRQYGLNSRIPIHEYRDDEIYKIERTVIPELIEKYPNKGYLKYLGSNKVDLVTARRAQNFDIIRCKLNQNTVFLNKFFETYLACREYFTSVIYVKEFSGKYDLYDNFIAMNIMMMTVQRMMINTLKIGIERDFYDLPSIKALFDSYGLPFFEDLPLDYQRSIMKNLNMLLRYKSTDKVLYDISNILFFDRIKIFKYFLIKDRNFDRQDNPIFVYKEVINEDGEVELVEDVEKMYSFYFQSTDVLERNTALALENNHNKISYEEVTDSDLFWWHDEDVQKVLYEQEFNYVETKYLSVNAMYRITETMFESIYALNMLADKKESSTNSIYIDLPRITLEKITVFDAVIMLFALTSKKCGMKGNIISSPTQILSVLGFNFKANFEEIINKVYENKSNLSPEIVKYLTNIDITTPNDINDMYNNMRWLADYLTERINTTTSIKEYRACSDLYKTLMIKDYTTDILKKKDGTVASTYLDYLNEYQPDLGSFVENCSKDKTAVYIKHILGKINELIPELEHMGTLEGSDSVLSKALMKLIEFFKSYTVDLNSLNVLYVMDSKYYNMIRMVHDINHMSKIIQNNENSFREYFDNIATHVKLDGKDQIEFLHRCFISKDALFKYLHEIIDTDYINKTLGLKSNIPDLTDKDRAEIFKIIESFDETNMYSKESYYININSKDKVTMKELIREVVAKIFVKESSVLNLYNDMIEMICKDGYRFKINLEDFTEYFAKLYIDIYLTLDEKYELSTIVDAKEIMLEDYIDTVDVDSKVHTDAQINLTENYLPKITISREDGWFNGLRTKLQNLQVFGRMRSMIHSIDVLEIFNQLSVQYNIKPEEWIDISNRFIQVEKGYKGEEFWHDVYMNANLFLLGNNYNDLVKSICIVSASLNIKPSELCKTYISLSREDNLKIRYDKKYSITSVIKEKLKSVKGRGIERLLDTNFMKPYMKKLLGSEFKINVRDFYKVYRSIHRDDRQKIKEKLKWTTELEARVLMLTNFNRYIDKVNFVKIENLVSDQMYMYIQHNLKSLLKLEQSLKLSKDMEISFAIVDIYNGFLSSILSLINIDRTNVALRDENPITIIRHNFMELSKIDSKLMDFKVDGEVTEKMLKGYYEFISSVEKEICPITDIPTIVDEEMCRKIDILFSEYLDKIKSIMHEMHSNIYYNETDLKNIKYIISLFGNIYFSDEIKMMNKIHSVNANISLSYIILMENSIHNISDTVYYNDITMSLLFNRILISSIVKLADKKTILSLIYIYMTHIILILYFIETIHLI